MEEDPKRHKKNDEGVSEPVATSGAKKKKKKKKNKRKPAPPAAPPSPKKPVANEERDDADVAIPVFAETEADDHCETPLLAFEHCAAFLDAVAARLGKTRKNLIVYDPDYCAGGTKERMKEVRRPVSLFLFFFFLCLSPDWIRVCYQRASRLLCYLGLC